MPTQLGMNNRDYGLAVAVFFTGYASMQIPVVSLIPKVGPKYMLALCLILWGAVGILSGFVRTKSQLFTARALLGIFESGYFPGSLYLISEFYPEGEAATPSGTLMALGMIGYTAASLTSGFIISGLDGTCGLEGWRWLFIVQGAPAILTGALIMTFLPNSMRTTRWLSDDERCSLRKTTLDRPLLRTEDVHPTDAVDSRSSKNTPPRQVGGSALDARKFYSCSDFLKLVRWETLLFGMQLFGSAMLGYLNIFFIPIQLQELFPSLTSGSIGLFSAAPIPIQFAIMIGSSRWVDSAKPSNLQRRMIFTTFIPTLFAYISFLCAGVLMVLSVSPGMNSSHRRLYSILSLVFTLSCGFMACFSTGAFWNLHHSFTDGSFRGLSIACVNSIGNLGGFVGPYLRGDLAGALGPNCPSDRPQCIGQWGWGTVILGGGQVCIIFVVFLGVMRLARGGFRGGSPMRG